MTQTNRDKKAGKRASVTKELKKRPLGVTMFCVLQWFRYTFFFTLLLLFSTYFLSLESLLPLTIAMIVLVVCFYFIKLTLDVWELDYIAWQSYLKLYILALTVSVFSILFNSENMFANKLVTSGVLLEGLFGLWLYDIKKYMNDPEERSDLETVKTANNKTRILRRMKAPSRITAASEPVPEKKAKAKAAPKKPQAKAKKTSPKKESTGKGQTTKKGSTTKKAPSRKKAT